MNTLFSITFIVTCLGALQWGLIGLGGFIGKNMNGVAIISRGNALVEYCIYLFVGLCALTYVWITSHK